MKIAFDIKLMRPGCAIIQALYGGDSVSHLFDTNKWLLSPTPDLKLYEITQDQLKQLVKKVNETVNT